MGLRRHLAALALAGALTACAPGTPTDTSPPPSTADGGSAAPSATSPGTPGQGAPAASAVDWSDVAKRVSPSVVAISVQARQGSSSGSGVVIDDKHVVTNHHVIAAASQGGGQVLVTLHDERVFATRLVGSDAASDLAVLEVVDPPKDLTAIETGSSDDLVVGAPVMAVGNPLGLAGTVTTGIVSALNRPVTAGDASQGSGEPVVTNAIQTSAAVNPGNSGGALVDADGKLVGINSSIATLGQGSGNIGISFAITQRQMQSVVDQILTSGTAQHPWLGVRVQDAIVEVDGSRRWAAGLGVVGADTPAQKAGLKDGDGITAIDGEAVDSALSLIAQVRERRVGSTAKLTVVRDGKQQQLEVSLAARPS